MVVTFKNGVSADVVLFGDTALELIRLMGRAPSLPGVLKPEEISAALAELATGLAAAAAPSAENANSNSDEDDDWQPAAVSLAHRAGPLIELLEKARAADKAVLWDEGLRGY